MRYFYHRFKWESGILRIQDINRGKVDRMIRKKSPDEKNVPIPARLPFLSAICWQTKDIRKFSPIEMLERYERGWRYKGVIADLGDEEREFISRIAKTYGSWIVNDV